MLIRTHLAITIFGVLLYMGQVEQKIVFVLVALAATYVPDIDSRYSKIGKYWVFRPFQFFVKHRDFIHSILFMILIAGLIFVVNKSAGIGFVFGYGLHLLADCFSLGGVRLFWPAKFRIRGFVKTNGVLEWLVFGLFFVLDVWLIVQMRGIL